jgi:hypothetical protein
MRNIGSFNTRSIAPIPADVLIDVWEFADAQRGIEINIHPDDVQEVSTCVMISGTDLAELHEAVRAATEPSVCTREPETIVHMLHEPLSTDDLARGVLQR